MPSARIRAPKPAEASLVNQTFPQQRTVALTDKVQASILVEGRSQGQRSGKGSM
jgi:hypothetical protein